jgi:hypothetical protein
MGVSNLHKQNGGNYIELTYISFQENWESVNKDLTIF